MKDEILKMILSKIKECEDKAPTKFIVDRIDVVALKELYNEILIVSNSSKTKTNKNEPTTPYSEWCKKLKDL